LSRIWSLDINHFFESRTAASVTAVAHSRPFRAVQCSPISPKLTVTVSIGKFCVSAHKLLSETVRLGDQHEKSDAVFERSTFVKDTHPQEDKLVETPVLVDLSRLSDSIETAQLNSDNVPIG